MAQLHNAKRTPARWPADLKYLCTMAYSSSIPPDILKLIKGTGNIPASDPDASVNAPVTIRCISNPAHPAHQQMGLFASKKIPPHSHILDYLGEVHADERTGSDYDLSIYCTQLCDANNAGASVNIDALSMGNEARFINDYRGIRPRPNALFKERRTLRGELRMSIWSDNEAIRKGDEILVSYGKSWWRARQGE
ncbi:hypothetical protein DFH11DRAFT_1499432 [Phellopilus nigrolimitatus]|nr:hypothetical protein DFH11DRAFT_1499432 [Phellopilus nigrolimitatus]